MGHAVLDSPLGPLLAAVGRSGLVRLAYLEHEPRDAVLESLATRLSASVVEAPQRVDAVRRQLDEYFSGRRPRVDVPLDLALAGGFGRRVLRATAEIPPGGVESYGALAARAGSPGAARAVGNALGSNPVPIVVPCHRVVRAGGGLGGYTGGVERKRFLLELEARGRPSGARRNSPTTGDRPLGLVAPRA